MSFNFLSNSQQYLLLVSFFVEWNGMEMEQKILDVQVFILCDIKFSWKSLKNDLC